MRDFVALLARFGLAGLINTAVGFAVTAILDVGFKLPPALANAGGYAVGIAVSLVLNRTFVFRSQGGAADIARYLVAIAAAFALNQLVLRIAGEVLGRTAVAHLAAQLCAMASYSVALFVLCRLWVFKPAAASPA